METFILDKNSKFPKTYPFHLTFNEQTKGILKRYCNYKLFSFVFVSEAERNRNIESIKQEIKAKYTGNLKLDF